MDNLSLTSQDIMDDLTPNPLIDSHCHLDYLQRDGANILDIIANARAYYVNHMVTISTSLTNIEQVLAIAQAHDTIYASVGVHPHQSGQDYATLSEDILLRYANHPKAVAIGETGLDYYYDSSPRDTQINSFKMHINVARQTGLPLVIHTRDADADTCSILEDEYKKGAFTGLIHCFSTSRDMAETALKIGFYISLSGIITFKKSQDLRDIVHDIPLERLLVETDSPYLAPIPKRGQPNQPAFTYYTAKQLAAIKGVSIHDVARITTQNCHTIFSKARFR